MTKENWIDICGYERLYQLSNLARVKSLRRITPNGQEVKERILKSLDNTHGYQYVSLSKNGVLHKEYIHRLVAKHFLDNPMGYKCVNHKDENKSNNNANNLEWCTVEYNNNYGTAKRRSMETYINHGTLSLQGREEKGIKLNIWKYDLNGNLIKRYDSVAKAQIENGMQRNYLYSASYGKRKTVLFNNYIYSYKEL